MRLLKRIFSVTFCLLLICQSVYATPKDEATRLNELYAMPIEFAMKDWWDSSSELMKEISSGEINEVKFALYFLNYAQLTNKEIEIRLEYLAKEVVSPENADLKLSIQGIGHSGKTILKSAMNFANLEISKDSFINFLEEWAVYYGRARLWCSKEYRMITNEERPTLPD